MEIRVKAREIALGCCVLAAMSGAARAEAEAPLSAIDWLSHSIAEAPEPVVPEVGALEASLPPAIKVLPLDAAVADSAGLVDAGKLGLPRNLWGRSAAGDLAQGLMALEVGTDAPPVMTRFLADLLQARLDPPIDAAIDDRFFLARIDRLLEKGHLDAARALIRETGQTAPQFFRRAFDIALLSGDETEACREIETTPELSPTYPARIFCLARLGQFDVAALTLGNAESLGILNAEEDRLLLHFLDPELFEGEPLPAAPRLPTPLEFRLYEAVGERIATDGLPVPFAVADLSDTVGWKARLSAAERLAATGAMPFEDLLAVFAERGVAASGGVWERVRAVRDLAAAVERGGVDDIRRALPKAWAAAGQGNYRAILARWLLPALTDEGAWDEARHLAFEVALLAEAPEVAARFENGSPEDMFLLSLARGDYGTVPPRDALGRAVLRGLSSVSAGGTYETLIADDRRGEVLFRALGQLANGATGNPDSTTQSLAALRRIGLDALARQIAVELVLGEGAA